MDAMTTGLEALMAVPVLVRPTTYWECPNCTQQAVTHGPPNEVKYHTCRGLKGLAAPMVEVGTKAKVEAVERGDYVGQEVVQTDGEGRPVMSIITTRDEGQDCAVLAPTASALQEG